MATARNTLELTRNEVVQNEETALLQPDVNAFDDASTRRGFLFKVFIILSLQLTVITAIMATFMRIDCIRDYFTNDDYYELNMILGSAAATILFISVLSSAVIPGLQSRKKFTAAIFAGVTVAAAIMLSIFSTMLSNTAAMTLLGITASCCFGISVFVLNVKYDLVSWQGAVFCLLWGFLSIAAAIAIPIPSSTTPFKIVTGLVGMVMLVLLVAGILFRMKNHEVFTKDRLEPDQYLAGALELFGILTIFFSFILVLVALLILFMYCGRKRSGFEEIGNDN